MGMPERTRCRDYGLPRWPAWLRSWMVNGIPRSADSYPSDVKFMKTEDVGKLLSDLGEAGETVEQRYRRKPFVGQEQLNRVIAKHGWHPTPLEVLNGNLLTDGHHRYAAARQHGVDLLPVRHWQRAGSKQASARSDWAEAWRQVVSR